MELFERERTKAKTHRRSWLSFKRSCCNLLQQPRSSRGISTGVMIVLIAVAQLVFFGGLIATRAEGGTESVFTIPMGINVVISRSDGGPGMIIPLIAFFILLIPAVALIIYNSLQLQGFEEIDKGTFQLDVGTKARLQLEADNRRNSDNRKIVLGVTLVLVGVLCVLLSSLSLFTFGSPNNGNVATTGLDMTLFGVTALLILIGVAARLFILFGMERTAYDKLLKIGDYAPELRKSEELVGVIASFYWPCTIALYLLWSFTSNDWHQTWIIWPIAGVLFGGIAAFTSLVGQHNRR